MRVRESESKVVMCTRMVNSRRINVLVLNVRLLEEVRYFRYSWLFCMLLANDGAKKQINKKGVRKNYVNV